MLPFLTQLWLFATPIVYPSSLLPAPGGRSTASTRWPASSRGSDGRCSGARRPATLAVSAARRLRRAGWRLYFRRMERTFADVV